MIAVTGASSGLGREVALRLEGPVVATARRAERLEALTAQTGGRVRSYPLDLTDLDAVDAFAAHILSEACDALVLNAGITAYEAFLDGSADADEALIATNITANVRLLRRVCAEWAASGTPGRALIVASIAGLTPVPFQSVYAGTKAFMVNFGLSLREELAPQGITVGVFAPGGIATEMTDGEAFAKHRRHLAPVGGVAAELIAALDGGGALTVPGAANKATAAAAKLLPRSLVGKMTARVFRPD